MNYKSLFELYDKDQKNFIRGDLFLLILDSLGLSDEYEKQIVPTSIIAWNEYSSYFEKVKLDLEKEDHLTYAVQQICNGWNNECLNSSPPFDHKSCGKFVSRRSRRVSSRLYERRN